MSELYSVKVSDLTVQFGDFYAVKNIEFSVKKGEIFGFLGANGAGKTTTIRVLCGLLKPTKGHVEVAGIPYKTDANEIAIKQKTGYMSQKFTLYDDLTIEENLSFIAALRDLDKKNYLERRQFILDFISFNRSLKSFVRELPGGIKQQVALAAAILHDPDIVFLDEPTAGVSPFMRARFWSLIKNLADLGKTIFVTTHYLDESLYCERIALMRAGEIIALNTPDALKRQFFKNNIVELVPKEKINYSMIEKLKKRSEFTFFEPYGLRFHVEFQDKNARDRVQKEMKELFEFNEINPSMEDVFIKSVEHQT